MSFFGGDVKDRAGSPSQQKYPVLAYQVQSSCQGAVIPLIYGQTRIPGNIIWASGFGSYPNYSTSEGGGNAGGKGGVFGGGGGGNSMEIDSYTYYMAVIIGLCLGPITKICGVYANSTYYQVAQWFEGFSLGGRPAEVWSYLAAAYPGAATHRDHRVHRAGRFRQIDRSRDK